LNATSDNGSSVHLTPKACSPPLPTWATVIPTVSAGVSAIASPAGVPAAAACNEDIPDLDMCDDDDDTTQDGSCCSDADEECKQSSAAPLELTASLVVVPADDRDSRLDSANVKDEWVVL